ncbi:MAG: flagellin, partial [Alphaproteobacteria bacterium]|nr:flagellin [Alphaproteobacteria bacterium]
SMLQDMTQERLATGKKVNSALDNPSSYFTAQSLNNRAGDLSDRLDGIGQALQTLKAADKAIQAITALVTQAKALANNALDNVSDSATVKKNMTDFQIVMAQINSAVNDASYKGVNLLKSTPDNLIATFNEDGTSKLTVTGISMTMTGLSITTASTSAQTLSATGTAGDWGNVSGINLSLSQINNALTTLRTNAASFGTSSAIIQTREDFAKNLITTLKAGADKLTLADMNEEAANMLALQTQRQMGTNSLSMASQAAQSVLQMFR